MAANRFTKFSGQQYVSNYTPVPFEAIMQVGAQKQAIQDKAQEETATVDNNIQKLKALPQYKEYATKAVSDIHEGISKYATMDFNDPSTRQAWNKERINIASRYAPTGDLGKINMDYELGMKWQQNVLEKSGGKDQWGTQEIQNYSNQFLNNWKDDKNNFQGAGFYGKVNEKAWLDATMEQVNADKTSMGMSGPYGTGIDFVNVFKTGTTKELKYGKIMRTLIGRAEGDTDLQQSLIQRGRFNGVDDAVSTQFTVDSGKKDKEGKPIYEFNMANPFVRQADALAQGAAYKEEDSNYNFVKDDVGIAKATKKITDGYQVTQQGEIKGIVTSQTYEKTKESIVTLQQELDGIKDTPQNKIQREQIKNKLQLAKNYNERFLNSMSQDIGYLKKIQTDWAAIASSRASGSMIDLEVGGLNKLMNTPEAKSKIKTSEDYQNWLKGKINLNEQVIVSWDEDGNVYSDNEAIKNTALGFSLDKASTDEVIVTNTATTIDDSGDIGLLNTDITNFIIKSPTNFVTEDGRGLSSWQQEAISSFPKGTEAKFRATILNGTTNDGKFGYLASYTDANGQILSQKVIYPEGTQAGLQTTNAAGNILVSKYKNDQTETGKAYTSMGQKMIATTTEGGKAVDKELLISTADAMKTPAKGKTTVKEVGETTIIGNGVQATIKFRVTKSTDNLGQVSSYYTPLDKDGFNIFSNVDKPIGATSGGSFTSIDDMQIALSKDVLALPQSGLLIQRK